MIRDLQESLTNHRFFSDLNDEQIEFLVSCASNRVLDAGEYVFREGVAAESLYLVRDGMVALEMNSPGVGSRVLATIGPGEMLGWTWLVPPHTHQSDCRAVEKTRLLALDAGCLRDKLVVDHELGYQLLVQVVTTMAKRLSGTRLQLLDLYANGPTK